MATLTKTSKVKLYNAKTGETVIMQAWAAEHALKHNHVSRHGKYCRVSEIEKYITLPKAPKPVQDLSADMVEPRPRRTRKKAEEVTTDETAN